MTRHTRAWDVINRRCNDEFALYGRIGGMKKMVKGNHVGNLRFICYGRLHT